jgi:hypothetical protein
MLLTKYRHQWSTSVNTKKSSVRSTIRLHIQLTFCARLVYCPDDGDSTQLWNVGLLPQVYTELHLIKLSSPNTIQLTQCAKRRWKTTNNNNNTPGCFSVDVVVVVKVSTPIYQSQPLVITPRQFILHLILVTYFSKIHIRKCYPPIFFSVFQVDVSQEVSPWTFCIFLGFTAVSLGSYAKARSAQLTGIFQAPGRKRVNRDIQETTSVNTCDDGWFIIGTLSWTLSVAWGCLIYTTFRELAIRPS